MLGSGRIQAFLELRQHFLVCGFAGSFLIGGRHLAGAQPPDDFLPNLWVSRRLVRSDAFKVEIPLLFLIVVTTCTIFGHNRAQRRVGREQHWNARRDAKTGKKLHKQGSRSHKRKHVSDYITGLFAMSNPAKPARFGQKFASRTPFLLPNRHKVRQRNQSVRSQRGHIACRWPGRCCA